MAIGPQSLIQVGQWLVIDTQVSAPHPGQDKFGLPYWKV